MDLYEILSPFTVLLGIVLFVREMVLEFKVGWDSAQPLDIQPDDENPDASNQENDPDEDCETDTVWVYLGEPWFASVNLWSWGLQSGAILAGLLVYIWRGDEFLNLTSEWINAHPFWSGAIGLVCLAVALILGVLRQAFIKLLSQAAALPIEDEDGRPSLTYIGDVPPFLWQNSPWFRAGTWLAVTATSLIYAFIGAELFSQALGGGFILLFGLLLYLRWAVSSLPSRFWMG